MNAQEIATLAHQGQFRRDGVTPYIKHPEAVASAFAEGSWEWQVAWLHDVLEDTDVSKEDLLKHFDWQVVGAVELLTKEGNKPYDNYIKGLYGWESTYPPVILARKVKLADIAANLADAPTERQIKKYTNALKIIAKSL